MIQLTIAMTENKEQIIDRFKKAYKEINEVLAKTILKERNFHGKETKSSDC